VELSREGEVPAARVESLDREGRGVAHVDGKAVFIDGAVPGELVEYAAYRKKPAWELAQIVRIETAGAVRTSPRCAFFGTCGGCSMQHVEERAQVAAKQRVLEDALWHVGRVRPDTILRPIYGLSWGYRHRARLSVRWVPKKHASLVGFRERKSRYVTDMTSCEVLPRRVSDLIQPLRELIGSLEIQGRIPQVEVAVGEGLVVLVLRLLEAPSAGDEARLKQFAERHEVQLWAQPAGPDSARPFWPSQSPELYYTLPDYGVRVAFGPTDFTQVNHATNRVLVRRAMSLLDPRPGEKIGDYFCGLGNFTLPIARCGAEVLGVEGSPGLIARAQTNALANGLAERSRFVSADLFDAGACAALPASDKILLDPPREGAIEVLKSLIGRAPARVVYVSCDPATLARDSAMLVHALAYRLVAAGIVNMFPHTSHVEAIALFER